jgi:hypothetical protein
MGEKIATDMLTEEVYTPSAFSISEAEPSLQRNFVVFVPEDVCNRNWQVPFCPCGDKLVHFLLLAGEDAEGAVRLSFPSCYLIQFPDAIL